MKMYSVAIKKFVNVPDKDIKFVTKKTKRGNSVRFAVGTYKVNGANIKIWNIVKKIK